MEAKNAEKLFFHRVRLPGSTAQLPPTACQLDRSGKTLAGASDNLPEDLLLTRFLRLAFQITSLKHPRNTYRAGKNYSLTDAKKLAADLDAWLDDELNKLVDQNGALSIEKLEALKGREADLDVTLIDNDEYGTAFRHVQKIASPLARWLTTFVS